MNTPDLQPPPEALTKSDYGRFYLIIQQIYNHPGRDDLKDIFKLAADQNGGLISLGDFEQICNTLREVIGLPPFNIDAFFNELNPNSTTKGFIPYDVVYNRLFEAPASQRIDIAAISEEGWSQLADQMKAHINKQGGFKQFNVQMGVISTNGDTKVDLQQFLTIFEESTVTSKDLVAVFLKLDVHIQHVVSYDQIVEFIHDYTTEVEIQNVNSLLVMIRRALLRQSDPSGWKKIFTYTDPDNTGKIGLDNFIKVIRMITNKNMKREEIKVVFNHFDRTGKGIIDYNDLLQKLKEMTDIPVFSPSITEELTKLKEKLKKCYKPKIWLYEFQKMDINREGLVNKKNFEQFFQNQNIDANISYEEIELLFRHFDKYNDGQIYYDEFLDFIEDKELIIPPHIRDLLLTIRDTIIAKYGDDDWNEVFIKFDKNHNGTLSRDEMWKGLYDLNIQMSESQFNDVYGFFDRNDDNAIDYHEFINILKENTVFRLELPTIDEIISRIQRIFRQDPKRLYWIESFKKYDKSHEGFILYSDFLHICDDLNIKMTSDELLALFNHYDKEYKKKMDYNLFLHEMGAISQAPLPIHIKSYIDIIRSGFRRGYGSYGNWESLFQQIDTNHDGHISSREFERGLMILNIKLSKDKIHEVFNYFDADNSGYMDYEEFVTMLKGENEYGRPVIELQDHFKYILQAVREAFRRQKGKKDWLAVFKEYDKDGNGKLSLDEFKQCINRLEVGLFNSEIEDLFDYLDRDNSGDISFREFINYLDQECMTVHSVTRIPIRDTLIFALKQSLKRSNKNEWIRIFDRRTNKAGFADIKQFKEVMDELDVLLDSRELREIFSYYQNEDAVIDYVKFVNEFAEENKPIGAVKVSEKDFPDSSELQSKTDRICEIMRDGIKKCMKEKHYNHIEEIFGSEHIKRGKITPRRLFITLDSYINLRDSEKELLRQQLDYNGISIQDLINFIGLDYDVSVMMDENNVLRDTHKVNTNSLYIYNRLRNIMRQSVMTQFNEIDPLPLYEKINVGPRGTYATFDMFYSYIAKLQLGYTMYDLEDVLKRIDKNNDEHISYFEFHYFLSDENEIYRIWEENIRVELLTDSEKRKTLKHSLLNRDIRNCGLLSIHDINDCFRKSGVRISESELRELQIFCEYKDGIPYKELYYSWTYVPVEGSADQLSGKTLPMTGIAPLCPPDSIGYYLENQSSKQERKLFSTLMKVLDKFEKKFGLQPQAAPNSNDTNSALIINLGGRLRCQISFFLSDS